MEIHRTSNALPIIALGLATGLGFVPRASAQPVEQVSLTSEQRDVIRTHVLQERRASISTPAELFPAVGTEVPKNVEVFWMPPSAGLNRFRYSVINQRAVLLNYDDRRVIEIVE